MRKLISAALVFALAVGFPVLSSAQSSDTVYGTVPSLYRTSTSMATSVVLVGSAGVEVGRLAVGPEGVFAFTGVPAGTYLVRVLDAGGSLLTTSLVATLNAGSSELVRWGSDTPAGLIGTTTTGSAGGGMSTTTKVLIGAGAVGLGVGIYFIVRNPSPKK